MDYWSDASFTSEEEDEDEEQEELYDPRDQDYWAIEDYLERRGPPTIIDYAKTIGTVALRECVVSSLRTDIDSVILFGETFSWFSFWKGQNNYQTTNNYFSHDDWDAIGEYCYALCECCDIVVEMDRVQSCMIRILEYGNFKKKINNYF